MVHSDAKSVSIPVPDMSALIARLEAAVGGSPALTDDVLKALGFVTKRYPMDSDRYWIVPGDERHPLPPWCDKITVSLDAALALAERMLPGWLWSVGTSDDGSAISVLDDLNASGGFAEARAHTPAIVMCISILRAIQHGYEAAGEVSPILKAKAQGEGG